MSLESFKPAAEQGPERVETVTDARRTELGFAERFRKTGHALGFTLASMLAAMPAASNAEEVDVNQMPLESYEMSVGTGASESSYFEQRDASAATDRARVLAEKAGIEVGDDISFYAEGFVPTTINGEDVYEYLTSEEQEAVDGARRLSELMDEATSELGGESTEETGSEAGETQKEESSMTFESKPLDPSAY